MRRVLIIVTVLLLLTSCSKMTTSTDEPYPDTLPSGTTSQSNPPGSSSTPSPGALAEAVKAAPAVLENIDQYEDYYIYPNEFIWSCFTVDEDGIVKAIKSGSARITVAAGSYSLTILIEVI